jgi:amidase
MMYRQKTRREVLQAALGAAAAAPFAAIGIRTAESANGSASVELDGIGTAEAIRAGSMTAEEAVASAIRRAKLAQPRINAIVTETYETAMKAAAGQPGGAFGGVPTFIKDLDDVRGVPTHYGSRSFGQQPATSQSPFVDALQRAGLVSLGKSATPEFGLTATTEPLFGGPCRNPWNPDYSTGGSSGGAAALVAARVVPVAHATDGGGSIRVPASCCGVFGLKPSRDRTVSTGRPPAPLEISVGNAVSITVRDNAQWLAAVEQTGSGSALPAIGMVPGPSKRRLKIAVDLESLTGAPLHADVKAAVEDTARKCAALGHDVEIAPLPLDKNAFYNAFILYWSSSAAKIAADLSQRLDRPVTDQDLEPWTLGLAAHYAEHKSGFEAALATLRASSETCAAFYRQHDVLLTPTLCTPPPPIGFLAPDLPFETCFERIRGFVGFTPIQNASGTPGMSVPLHMSGKGIPIGSHFAARAGDERTLLELAYELEDAHPWAGRRAPGAVS